MKQYAKPVGKKKVKRLAKRKMRKKETLRHPRNKYVVRLSITDDWADTSISLIRARKWPAQAHRLFSIVLISSVC
jgi:hypothetical protein